jgi:hypothetical protein
MMFFIDLQQIENAMSYGRVKPRTALAWLCLAGSALIFGSSALAGDNTTGIPVAEGSIVTQRRVTDLFAGQVNIYVGGSFPGGTHVIAFRYMFDLTTAGNATGYITPLLFQSTSVEAFTVYTVVGIGKSFEVTLSPAPQEIPFEVIEGVRVPTGNFTFGFTTSVVNSSGVPITASPGVVDYDTPTDGGSGVGGPQTSNDWAWTLGEPGTPPSVTLGTTFAVYGGDYALGSPAADQPYRTYSAQAVGVLSTQ